MYKCKECNYETGDKSNYNKHLLSKKHLKMLGLVPPKEDKPKVYKCTHKGCDYETVNKSNYNRHLLTHSDESKKMYKYKCLACNEKIKDTHNLCAHFRTAEHIQNVREKFPDTIKKKEFQGIKMGIQPLDLSKRYKYIKDLKDEDNKIPPSLCYKRDVEEKPVKKCKTCEVEPKKEEKKIKVKIKKDKPKEESDDEEPEKINIKKYFKHEYFELDDKEVKNKVKEMYKWLKHYDNEENHLLEYEFGGLEDAIADKKYDDAYSIIYNFFTDPSIKTLIKEYKLNAS